MINDGQYVNIRYNSKHGKCNCLYLCPPYKIITKKNLFEL